MTSNIATIALLLAMAFHPAYAAGHRRDIDDIPAVARSASRTATAPVWVSSRAAFDKDGQLRSDLFIDVYRRLINENIASNPGNECRVFMGAPPLEQYAPKNSFDALVANSLAILSGSVTAADTGFFLGTPGTLYAVDVTDAPKAFGRVAHATPLLLFVPEATIHTARGSICSRSFAPIPAPVVGDSVLVFSYDDAQDVDGRLITVETRSQLLVQHGGVLFAPAPVLSAVGSGRRTVADVVSKVRENRHVMDVPEPGDVR